MSLYQELKEAGADVEHHESDLYVRYSQPNLKIVQDSGLAFGRFKGTDNQWWIDVPFMYEPFWQGEG